MKFKMSEKSLFAILLRSPWWVSFLIGALLVLLTRVFLPENLRVGRACRLEAAQPSFP
jgi:restriction system protein